MKFFGFNKKDKNKAFRITDTDRNWVEDNFKWLIKVFGYPSNINEQLTISEKFFPKAFSTVDFKVQLVLDDLCLLFDIDAQKIKLELHQDLRDTYGIPYEIEGKPFETETEIHEQSYTLHISNHLTKNPNRLTLNLIYEFIKIRLIENNLRFDTGEDTELFIYLAGIYFGCGIPLSQQLTNQGRIDEGFWETKWNYVSEMPIEVMAFALATYSKLINQDNPAWKNELPKDFRLQFERAIAFLTNSPSKTFNKTELEALILFHQADQDYRKNDFENAISTLGKVLLLTEDLILKADVYNNLGYYQLRIEAYEKSIPYFQKALQLNSHLGFCYDNLGYALIQTGQLEAGKKQLEKALQTENNDDAYSYRNLALYHLAKNEIDQAKSYFQMAFEHKTSPVDLLELHYANFLITQGEVDKGMEFLQEAVDQGEPEALKRMFELTNN